MYWSKRQRPPTAGLRIEFDRFYPDDNWFNDLFLFLSGNRRENRVYIITRFFNDTWPDTWPSYVYYLSVCESNFPAGSRVTCHGSYFTVYHCLA